MKRNLRERSFCTCAAAPTSRAVFDSWLITLNQRSLNACDGFALARNAEEKNNRKVS